GAVNLVGRSAEESSFVFRRVQTGLVQNYALLMLFGVFSFLSIYLLVREARDEFCALSAAGACPFPAARRRFRPAVRAERAGKHDSMDRESGRLRRVPCVCSAVVLVQPAGPAVPVRRAGALDSVDRCRVLSGSRRLQLSTGAAGDPLRLYRDFV